MRSRAHRLPLFVALALLQGCHLPGQPGANSTPVRPDQVTDFKTLYTSNCTACHGVDGRRGTAISLANPAYIAYAGEKHIAEITAKGITGSLMPAFVQSSGGLLTEAQINILARGIVSQWGNPSALHGGVPPPYESTAVGDPARGATLYRQFCLGCHAPGRGSLLDPAYLALISDGGLRTIVIAGKPEEGMPDWQGYHDAAALNDGQVADIVAFLAAHRTANPGRPFVNGPEAHAMPVPPRSPADSKGVQR